MLVVGLTGNIGCGKSSLSNIFMQNNIKVIDADIISREIMNDKSTLDEIRVTFGEDVVDKEYNLDRKKLAEIVFNNDEELLKLNEITHPRIKSKMKSRIDEFKAENNEVVVVDGALLIEAKYLDIIDKLVVITCNQNIQINRVMNRDNCSKEQALSRISSQMNQEDKIKYADYVIDNSEGIDELKIKSEVLLKHIKEKWSV